MRLRYLFPILVAACLGPVTCLSQIPEITEPITNSFGTYWPNLVSVRPDARQFRLQDDLGNVENADRFVLDADQVDLLVDNGFLISAGRRQLYAGVPSYNTVYKNFEEVYLEAQQSELPVFVTTDTLLHAFHRIFDHALMQTEEEFLIPSLIDLDAALLARLGELHDATGDDQVREAARLAATYLAVALRQLDQQATVPAWCEPELSQELQLIAAHAGRTMAPLFHAYKEDYSQYLPRGHYTRSPVLERYFLAMMWHGRMTFALREMSDTSTGTTQEGMPQRPDLARAALLITAELERDEVLADSWRRIFDPTWFFVGESDDLLPDHYVVLAEQVYGCPLAELTAEQICDGVLIQVFMDRAEQELPQPRIRGNAPQGMRLFGQRFTPDSWFLSELVWNDVGTFDNPRLFPSVLDVLSVLGSRKAEELQRTSGQEEFRSYREQLQLLRDWVAAGPVERWASTIYWGWIYTLAAQLEEPGPGYPPFMRSPAWATRQLIGTAGSWTELRHDTILYVKQSNTSPWTSPSPNPPVAQGYVEPNPNLFLRLAALAGFARSGLARLGILSDDVGAKLSSMEQGAQQLGEISVLELERRPLSNEQHRFISLFGTWLSQLLSIGDGEGAQSDDKDRAPVVADVHSIPDPPMVLEQGTGYPARMLVVADVAGRLQLCVGAAFVHYEFLWPMEDRLSDERWWLLLEEGGLETPWWAAPVLDSQVTSAAVHVGNLIEYPPVAPVVSLQQSTVTQGEDLELTCEPPATRVELRAADGEIRIREITDNGHEVVLSTAGIAPGELIVVVWLEHPETEDFSYALRARVNSLGRKPRRAGRRL